MLMVDDALVQELAEVWLSRYPAVEWGRTFADRPGYACRWRRGQRVVDLKELRVVAYIVALRRAGISWSKIAARLLRERVVTQTLREWSIMRCRRCFAVAMAVLEGRR